MHIWTWILPFILLVLALGDPIDDPHPTDDPHKFASLLYSQAMDKVAQYVPTLRPPPVSLHQIVSDIPQYDTQSQTYLGLGWTDSHAQQYRDTYILPLLKKAASLNSTDALSALGDIYTFGNFSTDPQYHKALQYYHRAVEIRSHPHAYFMLGFMYSTGMFGAVDADAAKGQLYYHLAMEAGDVNALLVMAYRLAAGIGCPKNCQLALVYYSKLARIGYQYLLENGDDFEPTETSFSVRLPDFNGGIYGEQVSETDLTVTQLKREALDNFEHDYDNFDRSVILKYFSALDEYMGHYDRPKNYTRAKEYLEECSLYTKSMTGVKLQSLSTLDTYRLRRCDALLGHMYLKGQGTDKDYDKALNHLMQPVFKNNSSDTVDDIGWMYEKGLITGEPDIQSAMEYYKIGIGLNSPRSHRLMSQLLISQAPFGDILSSPNKRDIVRLMLRAATDGDVEALYHFGEFIQSGYTKDVAKDYTCFGNIVFWRVFIERLQGLFFPHLNYAVNELYYHNYKNSLVGFLIAAEQGLDSAQVSAAWLLYQADTFPNKQKKTYERGRVESAMKYFQRASDQGDIDATIFLGDIYFYGVESAGIKPDYAKAFELYRTAAHAKSSHGCFNLAYMYEHGLGVVDGTVDYYMAKRYYDLSLKYSEKGFDTNQIPIYFTLFKLRLKYLLWGKKNKLDTDQNSWFDAFTNLGSSEQKLAQEARLAEERADERAREHHEGTDADDLAYLEPSFGDYFVLGITIFVFVGIFLRNIIQRWARRGDAGNQAQPQQQQEQQGWNFNALGAHFQRGNFEFHFMAL